MITLLLLSCFASVDNLHHVTDVYVLQVIDKENFIGRTAIGRDVKTCWFKMDTTDLVDDTDIRLEFPWMVREGTTKYDTPNGSTKTVYVFRKLTVDEEMELRKQQEQDAIRDKQNAIKQKQKERKQRRKQIEYEICPFCGQKMVPLDKPVRF